MNDDLLLVEPGEITVERIDRVLDLPDAKAWHLDLRSKYASIAYYGRSGGQAIVALGANEHTLYVDETRSGLSTEVRIEVPDEWIVLAECARYTCRIAAYKPTYKD